jgi:hypothetical protein
MRGQRSSIADKKVDLVLVAVRYEPDGRRLLLARGHSRRGAVWGDLELFDRERLVQQLQAGRRLAAGRPKELVGDFEVLGQVRLADGGEGALVVEGSAAEHDDLGLPLF